MGCTHMPFNGFVVPKQVLQPDPGKVDAIKHMEVPQDLMSLIILRNDKMSDVLYFQCV